HIQIDAAQPLRPLHLHPPGARSNHTSDLLQHVKEADIALDRVPIKRLDPHVPASQCRRRKEVRGVRGIRLDLVIPRLVALPGGDTKALVAIALDMRAECIHYTRRYVDIWGCGEWASYADLDILTHIWRDHQQRREELTGFIASQTSRTAAQ